MLLQVGILLVSLLSLLFGRDEAELVFAGDAMMHQAQLDAAHRAGGYDFSGYFDDIAPYVRAADYAVVNLETPIAGAPYSGYPCFNAPAGFIDALSHAGFDLFLTANNHTLDRGDRGLRATLDSLDARGLAHTGTFRNDDERKCGLVKTVNNIRIGFLNYTYGTNGISPRAGAIVNYIDPKAIENDVAELRAQGAEVIIACIHWGVEYVMTENAEQRRLAKIIADAGADAIIGGHPHVIQPMQFVEGQLTIYSLGNFISNMKTRDTRGGAVVRLKVIRDEDGQARIKHVEYSLIFTEPPSQACPNFRLTWADWSKDSRAGAFARAARTVFNAHNQNVPELRH